MKKKAQKNGRVKDAASELYNGVMEIYPDQNVDFSDAQ